MDTGINYTRLVKLLQTAYSAELAAAYAYRGHRHSVTKLEEQESIRNIEQEEWLHRWQVRQILLELGQSPRLWLELKYRCIGTMIGLLYHISGWFVAMYGAGKLESSNVMEYVDAAALTYACGRSEYVACFIQMAETEWEHEKYFRDKASSHWLAGYVPFWSPLPPKEELQHIYDTATTGQLIPVFA